MRRLLSYFWETNFLGLLHARWMLGTSSVVPRRNTILRVAKGCSADGPGSLSLGTQWEAGRFIPSQMIMRAGSVLTMNGDFQVYTGHTIWINEGASLILGSGYANNGLNLSCFERVEIGRDVRISENVTIRDSDNHTLNGSEPTKPIVIGDHVWIGIGVTILKGVRVGDGAVVAAGSVVTRDVPPRSLVAGVPAVVKKLDVVWN